LRIAGDRLTIQPQLPQTLHAFNLPAVIDDPDGFTYVRSMKSSASQIVAENQQKRTLLHLSSERKLVKGQNRAGQSRLCPRQQNKASGKPAGNSDENSLPVLRQTSTMARQACQIKMSKMIVIFGEPGTPEKSFGKDGQANKIMMWIPWNRY
jgi:hypothetical protein